jgi:hypothetical protein
MDCDQKVLHFNRKIITMDDTFLAGPNKETLLTAVAQDEKNQIVLIAFAIVESENADSWKFFLENLNLHFRINSRDTIIMSDRDLGLMSLISTATSEIVRCICLRHFFKNLKLRYRDSRLF